MPGDQMTIAAAGQRGPVDHDIRDQIVSAAGDHFKQYGYGKTTVSELADAIGFSKAYIYKFFDSKRAIGEAVSKDCIAVMFRTVSGDVAKGRSATEKLRIFFRSTVDNSLALLFSERRLYDIVTHAALENWTCVQTCEEMRSQLVETIIREGRRAGEFERKTPLDETCRAILQAMQPFSHPLMLEQNLDRLPDAPNELLGLVLRSLAP